MVSEEAWPDLPFDAFQDTYHALHMASQVAGKVALALAPPVNHSWGIAFRLTPRGFTTPTLPHGARSFAILFDLVDQEIAVETSAGERRAVKLRPGSVAELHRELMDALGALGLGVRIWPVPVEVPDPVPFARDTRRLDYQPELAARFQRILLRVERVFAERRCRFVGKCSPVHFFWGSFDLAVTRFSGRPAPPREGPAFQREAYSHEVISHGFWPGSAPVLEPAFYAYAVPEPAGLKEARVAPDAASYHRELGEFLLPYRAVREARDPEAAIAAFVDSTYDRAATLAGWDRAALERQGRGA